MAETKAMARAIYEALVKMAADWPADKRLAWASGLREDPRHHWADLTRRSINEARDEGGLSWREVSQITEDDDSEACAARVQAKQHWRNKAWEDFQAGLGEFQLPPGGMPSV